MAGLFVVVVVVWQPDGAHQQFSIAIIIFFAFLLLDATSARLAFGKHLIQWHCSVEGERVREKSVGRGCWGVKFSLNAQSPCSALNSVELKIHQLCCIIFQ